MPEGPTPACDCLMLPLKKLACGWCGHSNEVETLIKETGEGDEVGRREEESS